MSFKNIARAIWCPKTRPLSGLCPELGYNDTVYSDKPVYNNNLRGPV